MNSRTLILAALGVGLFPVAACSGNVSGNGPDVGDAAGTDDGGHLATP